MTSPIPCQLCHKYPADEHFFCARCFHFCQDAGLRREDVFRLKLREAVMVE